MTTLRPSPGTGPLAALAALVVVLLVTAVAAVVARAGSDERPAPPLGLPALLRRMAGQVAEVRGLEWKRPPGIRVVSPAALARRVRELNVRDFRPGRLAGDEATYEVLGVVPRDIDYLRLIDDLLAEQVKGFYDSDTKELVVSDDGRGGVDPSTALAIAHELTHALTDQHFDFGPRADALDDADRQEELAAFSALIEGDAVFTERRWGSRHLSTGDQLRALFAGAPSRSVLDRTPRFVQDLLLFPYQAGYELVKARHRAGGQGAVDAMYRHPPTSTEQVLHPERYVAGEGWAPPVLPDVAAASGCGRLRRGTFGEFQLSAVLRRHLVTGVAEAAARGWAGDAYEVVRCGRATGLVGQFQADAEADAARLAAAFAEWATGWADDDGVSGPPGVARVVRSGPRVDVVLADDAATADRVQAATRG